MYKVIEDLLNIDMCQKLILLSEKIGYKEAYIHSYRNNYRCDYTDEALSLELQQLLLPHIPDMLINFKRLSHNFEFYKYLPGQDFKRHRDVDLLEKDGVALVTVIFYLNIVEEGGSTNIYENNNVLDSIIPKIGRTLLFTHDVAHSAEIVKKGLKYVLCTDLIYSTL